MQKLSYSVVLMPEPEGGYTATVPAIPGCISYGQTTEEAFINIREALLLCLEHIQERGGSLPSEGNYAPIISTISLSSEEIHA